MISTDDEEFYNHLLLLRNHGLLRSIERGSKYYKLVDGTDEKFTFLCSGFNVRNTELHALLGIRQMKRLRAGITHRNNNLRLFLSHLDSDKYVTNLPTDGVNLFAFPIICKQAQRDIVNDKLDAAHIECRPLIAGNLFRHPMLAGLSLKKRDRNANYIHDNALYVGNHEQVGEVEVMQLVTLLNGC
jgi:CDP-6-deoxy-D-xylo-4-hexulose-3-dehydrase